MVGGYRTAEVVRQAPEHLDGALRRRAVEAVPRHVVQLRGHERYRAAALRQIRCRSSLGQIGIFCRSGRALAFRPGRTFEEREEAVNEKIARIEAIVGRKVKRDISQMTEWAKGNLARA